MDPAYLPYGGQTASDIRHLKQAGLFLPVRENDIPIAITIFDGTPFGIKLSGSDAFASFALSIRSPHSGLFIPEPEILIDFASAISGLGQQETKGLLILSDNSLAVVARPVGDHFADPYPIPLWTKVNRGSEGISVGFTRWAIGVKTGQDHHILWEHKVE